MISINVQSSSKRQFVLILLVSMIPLLYNSQDACSTGCLICSSSGQCSLCDVENKFALTTTFECEVQSLPNCLLSYKKDKCDTCSSPFYEANGECIAVEADNLIPGCIVYSSSSLCSVCSDDYYLTGGKCSSLTSERKVTNCLEYSHEGCELCVSGFPNYSKTQCSTWDSMDFNCLLYYTGQKCLSCQDGYQMNYQVLTASSPTVYGQMLKQNLLFGSEKIGGLEQNLCYAVNESSSGGNKKDLKVACEDSLTLSDACVRCDSASNYFDFKKKTCNKNPALGVVANIYKIENCLSLNLNFECVLCYNGFFLNYTKKKCFAHTTPVPNCLVMSQTIDSHCLLCEASHFLLASNNTCVTRTLSVENCAEYNFFTDKCNVCASGFSLQDSDTKCLEVPANCATPVAGTTAPLTCDTCAEDFFLFSGECAQIPTDQVVSFCSTYTKTTVTDSEGVQSTVFPCSGCDLTHVLVQNKFLLAANHTSFPEFTPPETVVDGEKRICVSKSEFYRDVTGCNEYIDGECVTCSEGGKLYTVENTCEKIVTGQAEFIDGCNVYKADGTCEQCIYTYKYEVDGKCYQSNRTNCRHFKSSQVLTDEPRCLACDEGFALHEGNCYDLRSVESDILNCLLYDNYNQCIYCASGYINHFSTSQTQGLSKSHKCFDRRVFLSDANADKILSCESFEKETGGNIKCQSCIKGYELSKTGLCIPCLPHFIKSNLVDSFVYDAVTSSLYCKNDFSPDNGDCLFFANEAHDRCLAFRKGFAGSLFLDELNNKFNYAGFPALSMSLFGDLKGSNWRHSRPENISQLPYRTARKITLNNANSKLKHYLFQNNTDYFNNTILGAVCSLGYARNFAGLSMLADDCNTIVKNCDIKARVFYPGLPGHLMSCSRCFGASNVLYFTLDIINKALFPNIDSSIQRGYATGHLPSTFCYENNLTDAVAHCGVYQVSSAAASFEIKCRSCEPQFKPTYDTGDANKVTACTFIEKCKFSSISNICEICDLGYGFVANSNQDTAQQSCNLLTGQVQFCLEWNGNQASPVCNTCRPGYNTPANFCEKSIYGDCSHFDGEGNCLKCEGINKIAFITNVIKEVKSGCLVGNYSKLPFCEVQYTENKCFKCYNSFLLNSEGRCFSQNSIINCSDFDIVSQKCLKCASNFYLDFDFQTCVPLYGFDKVPSDLGSSIVCDGTRDHISYSFISSVNKGSQYSCASTGISQCSFLDQTKLVTLKTLTCLSCENSYRITAVTPLKKCLSFEPIKNCSSQLFNDQMMLRCQTCKTGYYLGPNGQCYLRSNSPKCNSFFPNYDGCRECETGFYLDQVDNICKARLNKNDKCQTYFTFKDECKVYTSTFQYISQRLYDTTRAPPSNPPEGSSTETSVTTGNGIPGCSVYASEFICRTCDSNTYLYLNQCKAISTQVTNCNTYSSKNRCSLCSAGYFLADNQCKLILALNCLILENESKCQSCTFEFPFLDSDFNCKKNPDVPNCKLYTSLSKCKHCEDSFLLTSDSKCISVSSPVANCSTYTSSAACATCATGYKLVTSSSVTTCSKLNGIDPFCANAISGGNRCAVCKPGYVLQAGVCQKCDHENPGCAACDVSNRSLCRMCASGFTMDTSGKCNVNAAIRENYVKISYDI